MERRHVAGDRHKQGVGKRLHVTDLGIGQKEIPTAWTAGGPEKGARRDDYYLRVRICHAFALTAQDAALAHSSACVRPDGAKQPAPDRGGAKGKPRLYRGQSGSVMECHGRFARGA